MLAVSAVLFLAALALPFAAWEPDRFWGGVASGFVIALLAAGKAAYLPSFGAGVLWLGGLAAAPRSPARGLGYGVAALVLALLQAVVVLPARLLGGYYVMVAGLLALAVACRVQARRPAAWGRRACLAAWGVVAAAAGYAAFDWYYPPVLVMFDPSHEGAERLFLEYSDLTGRWSERMGTKEDLISGARADCRGRTVTFECRREGKPAGFELDVRVFPGPTPSATFAVPKEFTTLRVEVRDGVVSHTIE